MLCRPEVASSITVVRSSWPSPGVTVARRINTDLGTKAQGIGAGRARGYQSAYPASIVCTRMRVDRQVLPLALIFATAAVRAVAAADFTGRITFSGLSVPGASVSATRDDATRSATTDDQGQFRFADLDDGPWTIRIEMLGFAPLTQDIVVSPDTAPATFALSILPFDQITSRDEVRVEQQPPPLPSGFQRATVGAAPESAPSAAVSAPAVVAGDSTADGSADAFDGFLINGSVNNGAASPFAQLPAFGNNRRGSQSLFNGGVFVLLGNSALDARPYSFDGQPSPRPHYWDTQIGASFAGPIKLPGIKNRANTYLGYQHTSNHDATTRSTIVPTGAERQGDFSQTIPGLVIPASDISPQAASLLRFYPEPNVTKAGYNYQAPVPVTTLQDAFQLRNSALVDRKNQVNSKASWQRAVTNTGSILGFVDSSAVSGLDTSMNWLHRFSQSVSLSLRYRYTGLRTKVVPYFSNRENVSGEAGIGGNDQDANDWGPPTLVFSSGIASLMTAQYASNEDRTHAVGAEALWNRGRHNITLGGDYRNQLLDLTSQVNPRGTFTFTGVTTGSDLADFLLGIPRASAIAFGNAHNN